MRIALFGKIVNGPVIPIMQELVTWFAEGKRDSGRDFMIYRPFYEGLQGKVDFGETPEVFDTLEDISGRVAFLFSVGGDGTILDAVNLIRDSGIPVTGINLGRLGFLSGISKEKLLQAINDIHQGNFSIEKRTLLQLIRPDDLFGPTSFALNDLTVYKPNVMSMLTIRTWIDGEFLNTYWADGLIVATPTGSTAYSLSCTGPIITPDAETFVITPIASHNLTVRPIVIRDDSEIRIRVGGAGTGYHVSLDSRTATAVQDEELVIKKAVFKIHLLRLNTSNFFQTIREKLNWGLDIRN